MLGNIPEVRDRAELDNPQSKIDDRQKTRQLLARLLMWRKALSDQKRGFSILNP